MFLAVSQRLTDAWSFRRWQGIRWWRPQPWQIGVLVELDGLNLEPHRVVAKARQILESLDHPGRLGLGRVDAKELSEHMTVRVWSHEV
jgi:hypothetical protein